MVEWSNGGGGGDGPKTDDELERRYVHDSDVGRATVSATRQTILITVQCGWCGGDGIRRCGALGMVMVIAVIAVMLMGRGPGPGPGP